MAKQTKKIDSKKVYQRRNYLYYSISELADMSGVSVASLSRIETEINPKVHLSTIRKIAMALEVAPKTLDADRNGVG